MSENTEDKATDSTPESVENQTTEQVETTEAKVEEVAETVEETVEEVVEEVTEEVAADDLKKIEGIGPKIASIMNEAGIMTFADMANAEVEKLKEILEALEEINKTEKVVLVAHPRTKKLMDANNWKPSFRLIEPQGYFSMLRLMDAADLIISDSGGLQKEAYWLKKSCLILREETEWMELVENGTNFIAGTKRESILKAHSKIGNQDVRFDLPFYGEGNTAKKVFEEILRNA